MMTWSSMNFSNPSSFLMESIISMHDFVMMSIMSVLLLVTINLVYTFFMSDFNSEFFESHELESVWTIAPFLVLAFIVFPSLMSLYSLDSCLFCGVTVSIMGHQWYWSYFYKDISNMFFDSYMIPSNEGSLRLVDVDNRLVTPSHTPVRFLVSSADVIHSWTLPSFGVKMDAIPGRINQFCFSSGRSGVFFGQCSEICGTNHSFMPVVMESVGFSDFFSLMVE